jgi:hypothetical protein
MLKKNGDARAVDRKQIKTFVEAIFRHAGTNGYVSLRAFTDNASNKIFQIQGVNLEDGLKPVIAAAIEAATKAANHSAPIVFCPPLAVFNNSKRAREQDILKGLVLTVECDQYAQQARATLEAILGPATIVVKSGGEWTDTETGELQPKLHLHWRLKVPAETEDALAALKQARDLATRCVGGDPTNKPVVHPIRWPGSWHRKAEPRLCIIDTINVEQEIDLAEALVKLQAPTDHNKPQLHDDGIDDDDVNKWPVLVANISNGVEYHHSLVRLAAMLVASGMQSTAAANMLRGLMDASPASHDERWQTRYDDIDRTVSSAEEKYTERTEDSAVIAPVDLWDNFAPPSLPGNLLPTVIRDFAIEQGDLMGADPSGLAMAALAVCAAAIPDYVQAQPKKHDPNWLERPQIWVAIIGDPSTMKTPGLREAMKPLVAIDVRLVQAYLEAKREYDGMTAEEKVATFAEPPKALRVRLSDTTIEAAQEVLRDNPNGLLCFVDELSGWFGGMDKYAGHRAAMKDRGFWLQSYDGGTYAVNRIQRGSFVIRNLSVGILGGIQPEPMRRLAADTVDDGLLQRLMMVMVRPAVMGKDEPRPGATKRYGELVGRLFELEEPAKALKFDAAALVIREKLEAKHLELARMEVVNKKLASHIMKYNGLFARLALLWHCIEHSEGELPLVITAQTAQRVADFMHKFLLPHAIAFYAGVLGLSDEHDRLTAVAGYILARKLDWITNRHVQRGDRTMRKLSKVDVDHVFHQLDALGWVIRTSGKRNGDPPRWRVNPAVHKKFAARGAEEAARRQREREMIVGMLKTKE